MPPSTTSWRSPTFETKNVNLETKAGYQMEDSMLTKARIVKNNRKVHNNERETINKTIDNVKATDSHIVPRPQEPSSEKPSAATLAQRITFGTTKNKVPTIKEGTDIKARLTAKQNKA